MESTAINHIRVHTFYNSTVQHLRFSSYYISFKLIEYQNAFEKKLYI